MKAVDHAAITIAAHDIVSLVLQSPERILWSYGRPVWGLLVCRLNHDATHVIVSIDGCLQIARTIWPSHYVDGGSYPYDALVRCMSGSLRLLRVQEALISTYRIAGSTSGDACVVTSLEDCPWVKPDLVVIPIDGAPAWTAHGDAGGLADYSYIHPWLTLGGMRPCAKTAYEFFAAIGEPVSNAMLPPAMRKEHLTSHWKRQVDHELGRLRLSNQPEEEWLSRPDLVAHLAASWVDDGWRGPEAPEAKRIVTQAVQGDHAPAGGQAEYVPEY